MSVGTRTESGRPARRVHDAERVKSGAAQRAYARRRQRSGTPAAPAGTELTGRVPFVAAILAMFGCGLALTLVLTTRAAEDSYQLSDAREANRVLSDERAALQREVAAADSAPELATRARELGMIPADDPARLVVAPDGTVTVIGEPAPAQGPAAPPLNPPPSAPRGGADPGERIVPVPTTPPDRPAEAGSGNVLAAPGAEPSQGPAAPPPPGEPVAGQPPAGALPAPEPGAAPDAPAPMDAGVPPAVPGDVAAPDPGAAAVVPENAAGPGDAGIPAPAVAPAPEGSTSLVPVPPAGAPVAEDPAVAGPAAAGGDTAPPVPTTVAVPAPAGAGAGEGMR
ncbi:hypothetical protein [Nocardia sp. NPDC051750]|uniref:hypothetical protein n=1 Tax=Nocardia sp. NPDC051750 TaxID=3364325 RepID=UPI0037963442